MKKPPNYYEILGVGPAASPREIEEAARALNQKFPAEAQDPGTNLAYRQLVRAYEVLSDSERRAAYDEQLAQSGSALLEIELLPSRRVLGSLETEQLLYLLVNVFAPAQQNQRRQPVNLCLVFDRSTSMRGRRLKRVKAAAQEVIGSLSNEDIISVIMFSDRAEVVVPAGHANSKNGVITRIHRMEAAGGTEIYQGLKAGAKELTKAPLSRYTNHLVLMTDGHTYGDEQECLELARAVAGQGVTISAFGIGTDWNDNFLDLLVSAAGGHSTYIQSADQIFSHLQEQVEGLGATYARDVKLTIDFPATVTCKDVYKISPYAQPLPSGKHTLMLGTVEEGLPLSILLELGVKVQRSNSQIPLSFDLQATIPSRQMEQRHFEQTLTLNVIPGEPEFSPPAQVLQAVQILNLYRMNEKAWRELEAGEPEQATRRMQRLTSRLMEAGHTKLAQQALVETQRLAHVGTLSLEGRKTLKYGTRSLLTGSIDLKDHD